MAVRNRNTTGPVTALRASQTLGLKGDKGDPGSIGGAPAGVGVVIAAGGALDLIPNGIANQLFGMSAGAIKQFFTLTGDGTISSGAFVLAPVGTAGTYGDSTHVPVITTDTKGRITGITLVAILGAGFGAPVVASAGAHTMQPGELWGLVNPGEDWTLPAAPIVGQTLEFTCQGVGYSDDPVNFHGNGHNMQHPSEPATQATTVAGSTEGVITYRFRYDGSLYRCVN